MVAFQDLTGQRFGRLTVISRGPNAGKKTRWVCRCDCKALSLAFPYDLKSGAHRSCGCLHKEAITQHGHTKHGGSSSPEYRSWSAMRARCARTSSPNFRYYGGRGITVCDRWKTSFSAFLEDMGPRPTAAHSIDRIDNNGPYSPENCRWATRWEQQHNQRRPGNLNNLKQFRRSSQSTTE